MAIRPSCAECGISSPDTNTNYTLISQTGWRLTRVPGGDGAVAMEWRCPTCWAKHKASTGRRTVMPPASSPPAGGLKSGGTRGD